MFDFLKEESELVFVSKGKKVNKTHYINNVFLALDIETTSYRTKEGDKRATCYLIGVSYNDNFVFFRHYCQLVAFLKMLSKKYNLNSKRRIVVYIHNLSFEFHFLAKWLDIDNVFASEKRDLYYFTTTSGFEFRDSLKLSQCKLEKVAEDLKSIKIKKLVGDLDYSLIRHSLTEITSEELEYLKNDCLIVYYYIKEQLEDLNTDLAHIPLTKTGIVRNFCKNILLKNNNYKKLMKTLTISGVNEYNALRRAFQGGFTHANALNSGINHYNVKSYDFTSSYPAVMLLEKYPLSRSTYKDKATIEDIEELSKFNCLVFDIEFKNLQNNFIYDDYFSKSKCQIQGYYRENNGRIECADYLKSTITNIDFDIIKKMYVWDNIKITNIYIYRSAFLPKEFKDIILTMYEKKTTLKGVPDKEIEYLINKGMLNSLYGMSVQTLENENYILDIEEENILSVGDNESLENIINDYNNNDSRFLYYPWGVFITAYARKNLFSAILNIQEDYIYTDTDSIKFSNYEQHKQYFDNYNYNIIEKIKNVCEKQNLDIHKFMPKTIKGVEKIIGQWDSDGDYKIFKTCGAKRYMDTDQNNELSLTVAGLNKKTAIPFLLKKFNNDIEAIFNYFDSGFYIPQEASGKLTPFYSDSGFTEVLTDYNGVKYKVVEKSFINLEPTTFMFDSVINFIDFGYRLKQE